MKILFDECVPRLFKNYIAGHEIETVQGIGWSGKKNGELLQLAEGRFAVFLTVDQSIQYQQNLAGRAIAILILVSSNKLEDLVVLVPKVHAALQGIIPGSVVICRAIVQRRMGSALRVRSFTCRFQTKLLFNH